jgi:hypothetical protein
MRKLLLAAIALMAVTSCSNPRPDLKSPCVGAEGSPCDRRPVNQDHA